MQNNQIVRFIAMLLIAVAGCTGSTGEEGAGPAPPRAFFPTLQVDALGFAFDGGEWLEDFGDAAAYGPAFYVRAGVGTGSERYLAIARAARDYNLRAVDRAIADPFWYFENLEEVFMTMMGLVEYAGVTGETGALVSSLDALIRVTDWVVRLFGDYVDVSVGEFAEDLFGPTAVTAGVALIYLQYATYLDTPARGERIERAVQIVDAIDGHAFDGHRYRFRPDEDRLYLYPNAIMLLALNRLYELTGQARYLDRAVTVHEGIQPLRDPELGYYRSPYSQEYQGAQTDEYSTLSSQNYLMLGLLLTYQNTGEERFLDDAMAVMGHVAVRLYDRAHGKILHHWIDGRVARPDDPDYFCSGCNLQTLYVLWYMKEEVGVSPLPFWVR